MISQIGILILMFASGLVQPPAVDGFFFGSSDNKQLKRAFSDLDSQLAKTMAHEDFEPILRELKRLQTELSKKGSSYKLEALNLLLSLDRLEKPHTCNSSGFNLLNKIQSLLSWKHEDLTHPISKVINVYSREHAKICQKVYESNFKSIVQQLDKQVLYRVQTFVDLISTYALKRGEYWAAKSQSTLKDYLQRSSLYNVRTLDSSQNRRSAQGEAQVLRKTIEVLSRRDIDPKQLGESRLSQLVNDQLIVPCRTYTQTIGPELYDPVMMDEKTATNYDYPRVKYSNLSDEFKLALARHKICHIYLLDADFNKLIRQIMSTKSSK